MKTAGRENPNHGVALPRNRAQGAEEQNRSRSIKWAEKQEKFQPKEMCFFLTSTFIELTRRAGTAKLRVSRTRHRILWVGLWVGKKGVFLNKLVASPSRGSRGN